MCYGKIKKKRVNYIYIPPLKCDLNSNAIKLPFEEVDSDSVVTVLGFASSNIQLERRMIDEHQDSAF